MRLSILLGVLITCFLTPYLTCKSPAIPQTSYQGLLTSLNNKTFSVSKLSIAGKKNCIPVYTAPSNTDTLINNLSYNPKDNKKCFNLADIKEIEIPYPYAVWSYKRPQCHGKDKYLLIKVTRNDTTVTHYLIEPKRRINAHIKKNESVSLTCIPFSGFKKCTVQPIQG